MQNSDTMDPDGNSKGSKPMCLAHVASSVYKIIQEKKQTTFPDVADSFCKIAQDANLDSANDQRTMRRRVYDVLNVLCAAGIVTKEQKMIRYNDKMSQSLPSENSDLAAIKQRLREKENILVERATLLMFFKLLFQRNRQIEKPPNVIHLPAIFIGINGHQGRKIDQKPDGTRLEIFTQTSPQFFAQIDLFRSLSFPIEEQRKLLQEIPKLKSIEKLLIPNVDNEDDQTDN